MTGALFFMAKQEDRPVYLSTGSSLLNLACSDRVDFGFMLGKYVFVVGDSTSGKTWLTLTCMAEASINPAFDRFDFYYDNPEDGALMDMARYFGTRMAERVQPPDVDPHGQEIHSDTVESFYYHVDSALKRAREKKRPLIYVLDSQDSLTSDASNEKFEERKEAYYKNKDAAGSYGDGKAKVHSENIRRVLVGLRDTGSLLIVIGQTRDNLGMGMDSKTRSGGRALKFYAMMEVWTSVREKLVKSVNGEPRVVGVLVEARIKKNRITGKDRTVHFPIYHSYGIDDIGGCVDYLVEEEHWKVEADKSDNRKKKASGVIVAHDLELRGRRTELIAAIEEKGLQRDLRAIVQEVWDDVERQCELQRRPRYAQR